MLKDQKISTMTIKLIKTEVEYFTALERIEELFDSEEGTIEADELDVLILLVEVYENQYYSIDLPDPISAIRVRMAEEDLKQVDMVGVIGAKSKVSEVLNKKRKLNLSMIRNLHHTLHISFEVLVQEYELA